jgi:hypothetical protein
MQNQLVTVDPNATAVYQRMSDPMAAVMQMGKMFAASGMFGCTKEEQGQVLALACLIEGKSPFELMKNYFIIGGSLSMKSVAVLAHFQKAGGIVKWHSALNDVKEAKADFKIDSGELQNASYTIEDATREGLLTGPNKTNWQARPADMLRARLITKAVRMLAPGIIMGISDDTDAIQSMPLAPLLPPAAQEPANGSAPANEVPLEEQLAAEGLPQEVVVPFLISTGLLEKDKTMADLTPAARRRILKNIPSFVAKVREFQDKQPAPAE